MSNVNGRLSLPRWSSMNALLSLLVEEIYAAISECQELYPDPELSSDSELEQEEAEEEKDGSEDEEEEGFFTSADGLQHLTVEGEAVLAHLESILRVSEQSNGSAEGNKIKV